MLLLVFFRLVLPAAAPETAAIGVVSGPLLAIAILVWWLFFSRAPWLDRAAAVAIMIFAVVATRVTSTRRTAAA